MAGLGTAAQAPMDHQQDVDQQETGVQGEPASPEEQQAYDQFVGEAMDIIYPQGDDGQVSPQVLADLKGDLDPKVMEMFVNADPPLSGSPQDMVAAEAVVLTILIDEKLGFGSMSTQIESGADLNAVIMHAGQAIVEELIEVAEAAKIHDFSEQDVEGVWLRAVDLYRTVSETIGKTGYDKEELAREFSGLVEANNAGTLDKVLPGLPGGAAMKQEG